MANPKLTKAQQAQLEEAQEMVDRQAAALAEVEGPLKRMDAGEELSRKDRTILSQELGLFGELLDRHVDAESNPKMVENILREPLAFFFLEDGTQVQVRAGGDVRYVGENDEDYV